MVLFSLFVVTFCLSCFLLLVTGAPQFINCPTNPSCVSVPVSYQCSINTFGGADSLQWRVSDTTGGILDTFVYSSGASVGGMGSVGTQFTTTLTSPAGPIVSDITFTATMDINNYTVECGALMQSGITFTPVGTDANCPILIQGILPAPVPNELTIEPNYFNFSWTPQTSSPCLSSYIVFVNSSASNVTYITTDASLSLPVPSTNGTEYSISVVAVDTGGRYMSSQGMRRFIPDAPEAVTNFVIRQTYSHDNDDDDTVNIISIAVSWNEPPSSSRPNISSYIIYHNVTDPDTSVMVSNFTTTYNIPNATVGSVYTVGVAAINVLGTGPTASTVISITSIPSPTSTPMMTPSNSNTVPVAATQSTSAPTTSPTASTGGLNSSVSIGLGAGAAVIVNVILILIIFGCLIRHKPWKREKDSTEPIALVDKKDHGNSPASGQPIYQEAMSSEDIQREAAPTTGESYAQPNKSSIRRPPPQPQSELATYQDPSTIQRTQAPNTDHYAEVDKKPQQQAVYAQVDKERSSLVESADIVNEDYNNHVVETSFQAHLDPLPPAPNDAEGTPDSELATHQYADLDEIE